MNLNKVDLKIMVELYKSVDGLFPYSLFQRHKYGPIEIFKTVSKLKGLVEEKENKLFLTKEGKMFIEKNKYNFENDKFGRIPEDFTANKLEINKPYLPNISKLSKELLIL